MNKITQKHQPHLRSVIRHKIKDLIKKYVDVSERVYLGRPDPIWFNELPCVLISYDSETIENLEVAPKRYMRTLVVNIDAIQVQRPDLSSDILQLENELLTGNGVDELDDWCDSRAYEIEYAMLNDNYLEIPSKDCEWLQDVKMISQQPLQLTFEGDQKVGGLRVVFNIEYETGDEMYGSLDEFLNFNSKINTDVGAKSEDEVLIRNT